MRSCRVVWLLCLSGLLAVAVRGSGLSTGAVAAGGEAPVGRWLNTPPKASAEALGARLQRDIIQRQGEVHTMDFPMPVWNPPFPGQGPGAAAEKAKAALETVPLRWDRLADEGAEIPLPKNLWKETSLDTPELSPRELAEDPTSPAPNDELDGMQKKMEAAPSKQQTLNKKAQDIMDAVSADQGCQATRALCHKNSEAVSQKAAGGNLDDDALLARATKHCAPMVEECLKKANKKKDLICLKYKLPPPPPPPAPLPPPVPPTCSGEPQLRGGQCVLNERQEAVKANTRCATADAGCVFTTAKEASAATCEGTPQNQGVVCQLNQLKPAVKAVVAVAAGTKCETDDPGCQFKSAQPATAASCSGQATQDGVTCELNDLKDACTDAAKQDPGCTFKAAAEAQEASCTGTPAPGGTCSLNQAVAAVAAAAEVPANTRCEVEDPGCTFKPAVAAEPAACSGIPLQYACRLTTDKTKCASTDKGCTFISAVSPVTAQCTGTTAEGAQCTLVPAVEAKPEIPAASKCATDDPGCTYTPATDGQYATCTGTPQTEGGTCQLNDFVAGVEFVPAKCSSEDAGCRFTAEVKERKPDCVGEPVENICKLNEASGVIEAQTKCASDDPGCVFKAGRSPPRCEGKPVLDSNVCELNKAVAEVKAGTKCAQPDKSCKFVAAMPKTEASCTGTPTTGEGTCRLNNAIAAVSASPAKCASDDQGCVFTAATDTEPARCEGKTADGKTCELQNAVEAVEGVEAGVKCEGEIEGCVFTAATDEQLAKCDGETALGEKCQLNKAVAAVDANTRCATTDPGCIFVAAVSPASCTGTPIDPNSGPCELNKEAIAPPVAASDAVSAGTKCATDDRGCNFTPEVPPTPAKCEGTPTQGGGATCEIKADGSACKDDLEGCTYTGAVARVPAKCDGTPLEAANACVLNDAVPAVKFKPGIPANTQCASQDKGCKFIPASNGEITRYGQTKVEEPEEVEQTCKACNAASLAECEKMPKETAAESSAVTKCLNSVEERCASSCKEAAGSSENEGAAYTSSAVILLQEDENDSTRATASRRRAGDFVHQNIAKPKGLVPILPKSSFSKAVLNSKTYQFSAKAMRTEVPEVATLFGHASYSKVICTKAQSECDMKSTFCWSTLRVCEHEVNRVVQALCNPTVEDESKASKAAAYASSSYSSSSYSSSSVAAPVSLDDADEYEYA